MRCSHHFCHPPLEFNATIGVLVWAARRAKALPQDPGLAFRYGMLKKVGRK